MEEKNLKEGQVAEQTTSQQDENMNMSEVDALKEENVRLAKDLDSKRSEILREYRKVEILKGALKVIREKYSVTDGDFYAAMLSGGNGELDIDTILYQLSK